MILATTQGNNHPKTKKLQKNKQTNKEEKEKKKKLQKILRSTRFPTLQAQIAKSSGK
jgi:hypothetical protein